MREGELYKKLKQLASELIADNPRKRPPLDSWRWDGSMHENELGSKTKECQMCTVPQHKWHLVWLECISIQKLIWLECLQAYSYM